MAETFTRKIISRAFDAYATPSGYQALSDAFQVGSNTTSVLLFENIDIPDGSEIVSVYIHLKALSGSAGNSTVRARAIDNPTSIGASSKARLDALPKTSNSVSWVSSAGDQTSPNLKDIIEEIFARDGWTQGNNLELILTGSGANLRTYKSYDYALSFSQPDVSPTLEINYNPVANSSRATEIRGGENPTSERSVEMHAVLGKSNNERDSEIHGGIEEDDARLAEVRGGLDADPSERDAEILGGVSNTRAAEIEGVAVQWYDTAWVFRKKLTVESDLVEDDLSDFVVLVDITDTDLLAKALSTGNDILFTDIENNKLKHEIDYYDNTTGHLIAWVRIPTLSGSVDTDFYIYFGNPNATNQEAADTWPTEYKAVFHLSDLTTSTLKDSSSFTNNATKGAANQPVEAVGNIHKGQSFANNNYYAEADDGNHLDFASSFALSLWINTDNAQDIMSLFNKWAASNRNWWFGWVADTTLRLSLSTTGSNNLQFNVSADIKDGGWHHILAAYVASTSVKIWVDGELQDLVSPPSVPASLFTGTAKLRFSLASGDTNQGFLGLVDEAKLLTNTDDDFLLTIFNNESDPSSFVTVSPLESIFEGNGRFAEIIGSDDDNDERSAEIIGIERSDRDAEITGAARDWWDTDWAYRKEIEIKYTEVEGSADLENIPILIDITDDDFANAQDDGDDFVFTDDTHVFVLPHEIDSFASNRLRAWVKIPRLKYNENTKINLYWGNTNADNQEDLANVWPVAYKGVYHLSDLTTSTIKDSSTFGNDGVKGAANQPVEADGQINKGQSWTDNNYYIEAEDDNSLDFAGAFSITIWVKNSSGQDIQTIINKWNTSNSDGKRNWWLGWVADNQLRLSVSPDGTGNSQNNATANIKDGEWHHIIAIYVPSTFVKIIVDGEELSVSSPSGIPASLHTDTSKLRFGRAASAADANSSHLGLVDEAKLSTITDVNYLLTVYNNESDPTNFIIVGDTEANITLDERDAEIIGVAFSDERYAEIIGGIVSTSEKDVEITGFESLEDDRFTEIHGIDTDFDGRGAEVRGKLDDNNERDVEIHGQDISTSEKNAEIHGVDTAEAERDTEIQGSDDENNERNAEISGIQTLSNEKSAEVHGQDTSNDNRTSEIHGLDSANSEHNAEVIGGINENSYRDTEIHGVNTDSNYRDAEIEGVDTDDNSRGAEIIGQLSDNSSRDAEIHGQIITISETDIEIHGQSIDSNERDAEIIGFIPEVNDERDAEITGQDFDNNERNVEIVGSEDTHAERDSEIHGQDSDNNSRDAEIEGVFRTSDSRGAEINGAGEESGRDAEIHGLDTTTDARNAEIHGSVDTGSQMDAEIVGRVTTNDSRGAEIVGVAFSDARNAEIHGQVEIDNNRSAEISGRLSTADEKSSEIIGVAFGSSRDAEIIGIASLSERNAEIEGGAITSQRNAEVFGVIKSDSSISAEINGAECPWFEDNNTVWMQKSETEWYARNPKVIHQQKRKIEC